MGAATCPVPGLVPPVPFAKTPHGIAGSRLAEFRGWTSSQKKGRANSKIKQQKKIIKKKTQSNKPSFQFCTRNGDLPVAYAAAVSKEGRALPSRCWGRGGVVSVCPSVCPSVRPPSWWPARPRARGCWRGGDAVCGECPFLCLVGSGKVLHPGFTHLPSLPESPLNPIKTPLKRGFSSPGMAGGSWPPGEGRFGSVHTFIGHK